MERRWWILSLVASIGIGCATSVPVDCPAGFKQTPDGVDCAPSALAEPVPDAGTGGGGAGGGGPITCDDLDCDDENDCTEDSCIDDACVHAAASDRTWCAVQGVVGLCKAGECVDCSVEDCRRVYPCTEQGIRDAIRDGGDLVIGCEVPTTVTLTEGMLVIENEVSLDGLGKLTINADQNSRVLYVYAPGIAALIGIGMTGGAEAGTDAGVVAVGIGAQLTLKECRLFGNSAGNHGGALGNAGTTIIMQSEITGNEALKRGGGLRNQGDLTIVDSIISGNHAGDGGGIYNTGGGVIAVEHSIITENLADDEGGGIWTSGPLITIKDSEVSDNIAGNRGGGLRVWTSGEVRVIQSTIARNIARSGHGGAILSSIGVVSLAHAVVAQNAAPKGSGGAVYNDEDSIFEVVDSMLHQNSAANGGAVYQVRATARFVRSAVVDNEASGLGGAFRMNQRGPSEYDLNLENSTVSGNRAGDMGGAIANHLAKLRLAHSTLAENEAPLGACIQQGEGAMTELAYSAIDGGCSTFEGATLTSLGFNAVRDLGPDTCTFTGATSDQALTAEEMNLGPLAGYGGPTPTHLPGPGSLLINAVPREACDVNVTEDQRGQPRGNGSPCDIGAVEVQEGD